jgi:hypothetical protein
MRIYLKKNSIYFYLEKNKTKNSFYSNSKLNIIKL